MQPLQAAVDGGKSPTYSLRYLRALQDGYKGEYRRLLREIQGWTNTGYRAIYRGGQRDAILDLAEAGKLNANIQPSTGAMHRRALELLANELYTNKNLDATVGRRYQDKFRSLGLQIATGTVSGEDTWRQAMQKHIAAMKEYGEDSFTDAGGKKWGLNAYAEMVARTTTMHVMNVGKMNEFVEHGEDLVVVADFSPTCPQCKPWGGKILSISGATKEYNGRAIPSYAESEEAGLWHPQCRHSYSLYIPEVWGEPDEDGRVSGRIAEKAEYAVDVDDLSDYMRQEYNATVAPELKDLNFPSVREAAAGIEQVLEEFPSAKPYFTGLEINRTATDVMNVNFEGVITYNVDAFETRTSAIASCKGPYFGYLHKNASVQSVGAHEAGHVLELALIYQDRAITNKEAAWNNRAKAKEIIRDAADRLGSGKSLDELRAEISDYAVKKDDSETLAEAVGDYVANGNNAAPLSLEIIKLLKERLS